jgi:chemotaxis methyl-accepting protein methylase
LLSKNIWDRELRYERRCATGEEPYTIAIILKKSIPDKYLWDINL